MESGIESPPVQIQNLPRLKAKYVIATANMILGILMIISALIMVSPEIFDSFPVENYFLHWLFFFGVVTFPVVVALSGIIPWVLYRKERYTAAIFWSFLPLLNIFLIAGTWIYFSFSRI